MKTFVIFLSLTAACLADGSKIEFRRAQDEAAPGYTQRQVEGDKESVYVHDQADFLLTPDDVREAKSVGAERKTPSIEIRFSDRGSEKMGRLTEEWLEKKLAILVDGRLVAAPVIRSKITGAAVIEGDFTEAEVQQIVRGLQGK
jgi:preprotein translocase subunit SecD